MPKNKHLFILILIHCLVGAFGSAQDNQERVPLKQVLDVLSKKHQIQFNYQSDLLNDLYVLPSKDTSTLNQEIRRLENQTKLKFSKVGTRVITITKVQVLCGYIEDVSSQQPMIGATVQSGTGNTISDDKGYFEIEVTDQDEPVEIRFLGYKTIKRAARFFSLERCSTIRMYEEEQTIAPIVLQGYLIRGIDKKADGTTTIDFSRFATLPGLIETDVLQTVQALPGVQSIDETVSNINIRGGSHDQNLILWDGIKMYQSGHFFGLISSFNPQITQKVIVVPNGTDAAYTDGVSGTLLLRTDKNLQNKFKGSFGVNLINADLFADIPLGSKSSIQIAARRSIDDVARTPTFDVFFERIIQETEIAENEPSIINSDQRFSFYDTSFRWLYQPTETDRIRLNFILIDNNLAFDETANLNEIMQTRESSLSQNSIGAGLGYEREWNTKFSTEIHVYNTDYKLRSINANVLQGQRFLQENVVSETGASLKGIFNINNILLETGYQFTESEIVNTNDTDIPRFLRRDSEVLREHVLFAQTSYRDGSGLYVKPGLRTSYIAKFDRVLVEPRLSVNKAIGKHFQVEVLGEFKHQNTSQIINFQNDFLGVERRRWQLTDNDSIPILRSQQASLGLRYNHRGWLLDAAVYYKKVNGITAKSQGFLDSYEFVKTSGNYDAYGIDFLMRKQLQQWNLWLSYGYLNSTYSFQELPEIQFRNNFDITHSLSSGLTFSTSEFSFALGANWRTGKPFTPTLMGDAIVDGDINYGEANSSELDDYLRLDFSAIYKTQVGKNIGLQTGVSVWNLLNRENPINTFFRLNPQNEPEQVFQESLGITPNASFKLIFH
ncbi:TonB-dependent receptor [Flagellimonas sp. 2504JD1-5]